MRLMLRLTNYYGETPVAVSVSEIAVVLESASGDYTMLKTRKSEGGFGSGPMDNYLASVKESAEQIIAAIRGQESTVEVFEVE